MKKVFQAKDGIVFETFDECTAHNDFLFEKWLTYPLNMPPSALIAFLPAKDDGNEWYGTSQETLRDLLRGYWEVTR